MWIMINVQEESYMVKTVSVCPPVHPHLENRMDFPFEVMFHLQWQVVYYD